MPTRPVLVFDGDCAFCTWSAGLVDRWAQGKLDVVPWQKADLAALALTAEACTESVQYVDGDAHGSGAAAVARALVLCRAPAPVVGRALLRPRLAPLAERVYRMVAANRHRLPGSTPACAA